MTCSRGSGAAAVEAAQYNQQRQKLAGIGTRSTKPYVDRTERLYNEWSLCHSTRLYTIAKILLNHVLTGSFYA